MLWVSMLLKDKELRPNFCAKTKILLQNDQLNIQRFILPSINLGCLHQKHSHNPTLPHYHHHASQLGKHYYLSTPPPSPSTPFKMSLTPLGNPDIEASLMQGNNVFMTLDYSPERNRRRPWSEFNLKSCTQRNALHIMSYWNPDRVTRQIWFWFVNSAPRQQRSAISFEHQEGEIDLQLLFILEVK